MASTSESHTRAPVGESAAIIASSTPSCAEQGTASARSIVVTMRSLRVSRMRVVIVAMVAQPSPRSIGSTAFPFSPMIRKTRFTMIARRGKYPESSRMLNTRKNVVTIGSTMARA